MNRIKSVMSEFPLVSVVTITFNLIKNNREKFIRQAIESVHNQTYQNIEHVIIDGASDDGTLEIFKDYPWLKVYSEPDKGIYDAMNKGVKKSLGKYIVFLNSDDFWHNPRGIEESINLLEANSADFSYAPCSYLDENDKFLGFLYPSIEAFFLRMPFCHQTMLTKKELVSFDTRYKSSADYDFVLRLILNGAKGVYVPLNFTSYRWIGVSSGKDNQYGNEACKLGEEECRDSLMRHYLEKFDIPQEITDKMWHSYKVKLPILEKICQNVDADLYKQIHSKLCLQKANKFRVHIHPAVRKISILFNARDLQFSDAERIFNEFSKMDEYSLYLYVENDIKIPEQYKNIPVFKGNLYYIDAFCSPCSNIPRIFRRCSMPCIKNFLPVDFQFDSDRNIVLNGNYDIFCAGIKILNAKNNNGVTRYYLFDFIYLWKTVSIDACENHYLFGFIKVFSLKN